MERNLFACPTLKIGSMTRRHTRLQTLIMTNFLQSAFSHERNYMIESFFNDVILLQGQTWNQEQDCPASVNWSMQEILS